jgi:hypothetical protein
MGTAWEDGGYSSDVTIYVIVDGQRYDVAQIGPETLILRDAEAALSGPAQIVINVDGREEVHHVILFADESSGVELCYA